MLLVKLFMHRYVCTYICMYTNGVESSGVEKFPEKFGYFSQIKFLEQFSRTH